MGAEVDRQTDERLAKWHYVKSGWINNLDEGDPEIVYFKRLNTQA